MKIDEKLKKGEILENFFIVPRSRTQPFLSHLQKFPRPIQICKKMLKNVLLTFRWWLAVYEKSGDGDEATVPNMLGCKQKNKTIS